MKFRIDLKILLFVFKAVNGLAPALFQIILTSYAPTRAPLSSNELLVLPWSKFKSKGDQAFTVAGPEI